MASVWAAAGAAGRGSASVAGLGCLSRLKRSAAQSLLHRPAEGGGGGMASWTTGGLLYCRHLVAGETVFHEIPRSS